MDVTEALAHGEGRADRTPDVLSEGDSARRFSRLQEATAMRMISGSILVLAASVLVAVQWIGRVMAAPTIVGASEAEESHS